MAHDVFISYSTKDKTVADTVCAKLEERKIRCWIAPRDIIPGHNFAESIVDAIDASKVFVLIWSANTNLSKHILNEINQAFDQGVSIIPFRIQDVQPTSEMRYYLGRMHWLDALTGPLVKHIDSLAETIRAILDQPQEILPDQVPIHAETKRMAAEEMEDKHPPERERKPVAASLPRRKKAWPILAFSVVALAAAALGVWFSPLKARFFPAIEETPVFSSTRTTAAMAVPTVTAAPQVLATVPAWVEDFSKPLLGAISSRPPDFQDDFLSDRSGWVLNIYNPGVDCSSSIKVIESGSLSLSAGPDPDCNTFANLNTGLGNYIFQVDMDLRQAASSDKAEMAIGLVDIFDLFSDGHWEIVECPNDNCTAAYSGKTNFDPSQPVTVTFISYGNRNAVYLNDTATFYYLNEEPAKKNGIRLGTAKTSTLGSSPDSLIFFDNIKIWDLDKIPNIADLIKN